MSEVLELLCLTRKFDEDILSKSTPIPDTLCMFMSRYDSDINDDCIYECNDEVDYNVRGWDGYTPLIHASEQGYTEIVGKLLHVSDLNLQDELGGTALIHASRCGHLEIVKMLIAPPESSSMMCADLNIQDGLGGTAVMISLLLGQTEIANVLMDAGAIVNRVKVKSILYRIFSKNPVFMEILEGHV